MKTKISTKELLKIFNPIKEEINYKNNSFLLNLPLIKSKINNLSSDLFEPKDEIEHFHNQVVNTILNYEKNQGISLNLENKKCYESIENGLLYYIASIYLKEDFICVEIKDNLTSENFIKSKKINIEKENFELFDDNYYLNNGINFKDEILINNFFSWVSGNNSLEKDINFFIKELEKVKKEDSIFDIYKQIPEDIKNSEDFISSVLIKNKNTSEKLIESFFKNEKSSINLNDDKIKKIIFNSNETDFISFVKNVYSINKESYNNKIINSLLYISELYEDDRTMNYLLTNNSNYQSGLYLRYNFNIANIYPKWSKEFRLKKELTLNYISQLELREREKTLYEADLLHIPTEMFLDFEIFKTCSHSLNFENLKSKLIKDKIPIFKLNNEQLLELVNTIPKYKFDDLVENFFDKKNINKQLAKEIIKRNNNIDSKYLNKFFLDLDFCNFMVNNGKSYNSINYNKFIKIHLFRDDLKEDEKAFLIKYLIATKNIINSPSELNIGSANINTYKEIYFKPEFMFYKVDDWSSYKNHAVSFVKNLKTEKELIDFLEETVNLKKKYNINYSFETELLFNSINDDLKNNSNVVFYFLKNIGDNVNLSQSKQFLYNKKNCFNLFKMNSSYIKFIPEHMYFDKEFALLFADYLDKGGNLSFAPIKVKKFFEQKDTQLTYSSFLNSFINYHELEKKFQKDEENNIEKNQYKRKIKI